MNTRKRQPVESTKTYRDTVELLTYLREFTTSKREVTALELSNRCKDKGWNRSIVYTILKFTPFEKNDKGGITRSEAFFVNDIPRFASTIANAHIVFQMESYQKRKEGQGKDKIDTQALPKIPMKPDAIHPVDLFSGHHAWQTREAAVWDNSIPKAIELLKKNGYKVYKIVSKEEEV